MASNATSLRMNYPQAFMSSYAPRVRTYGNALLAPVVPQMQIPAARTTKRGTTAINYAEDEFDHDDFEDGEGTRRPTGLRTVQRTDSSQQLGPAVASQLGRELEMPVELQGIWRDWMGKTRRVLYVQYIGW